MLIIHLPKSPSPHKGQRNIHFGDCRVLKLFHVLIFIHSLFMAMRPNSVINEHNPNRHDTEICCFLLDISWRSFCESFSVPRFTQPKATLLINEFDLAPIDTESVNNLKGK